MAINEIYKNWDTIIASSGSMRASRYTEEDIALISNSIINENTSFASSSFGAAVELHIYDSDWNLIISNHNITTWEIDETSYTKIKLNPGTDLAELGFTNGVFNVVYNFFGKLVGVYEGEKVYVHEISPSRKEIRIRPVNFTEEALDDLNFRILWESKFSDYSNNIIANFGDNETYLITNWIVDKVTFPEPPYSVVLKLYEPLPDSIIEKKQLWINTEIANPLVDSVNLITEVAEVTGSILRGPNFDIEVDGESFTETNFKSYEELVRLVESRSLFEYVSGSIEGIPLNTDYREFSNFVFFCSAEQRIVNFYNKISQVEDYNTKINSIMSSGSITGSTSVYGTITNYRNKRDAVLNEFDGYEKYMYYNSSSYESSSLGEFESCAWPKYNTTYPYSNYSISSSQVETWYSARIELAQDYDRINDAQLLKLLPLHIREDELNSEFFDFVNMVGQHFDIIWLYIKELLGITERGPSITDGLAKDLIPFIFKSYTGKSLSTNDDIINLDTYSSYYHPSYTGDFNNISDYTYLDEQLPIQYKDISKSIWKRILHSLPYILKTKGTKRSIEALLNCYGIPQTLLRIKEYGGPDIEDEQTSHFFTDTFKWGLELRGNQNISTTWRSTDKGRVPDTIEFRFNTLRNYDYDDELVLVEAPEQWGITLAKTGSDGYGNVYFKLSGSDGIKSITSSNLPIFYSAYETDYNIGDSYTVMLRRDEKDDDPSINQTYTLFAKNYEYGKILYESSGSLNIWAEKYRAHWHFNEGGPSISGTLVADSSSYGLDGGIFGNGVYFSSSKYGSSSLCFSGSNYNNNNYVRVPTDTLVQLDSDLTVMFWARGGENIGLLSPSGSRYIIYKEPEFSIYLTSGSAAPAGSVIFQWKDSDNNKCNYRWNGKLGFNQKWKHFAFVREIDTQTPKLFINGAGQGAPNSSSGPFITNVGTGTSDLTIGGRNNAGCFSGSLDEVIIYRRALTANEITSSAQNDYSIAEYWMNSYNRSFISQSRLYIGGATSSIFGDTQYSGSMQEFRLWSEKLKEESFDNHVRNPNAYNGNTGTSSYDDLYLWYSFNEPKTHCDSASIWQYFDDSKMTNTTEWGMVNGVFGYLGSSSFTSCSFEDDLPTNNIDELPELPATCMILSKSAACTFEMVTQSFDNLSVGVVYNASYYYYIPSASLNWNPNLIELGHKMCNTVYITWTGGGIETYTTGSVSYDRWNKFGLAFPASASTITVGLGLRNIPINSSSNMYIGYAQFRPNNTLDQWVESTQYAFVRDIKPNQSMSSHLPLHGTGSTFANEINYSWQSEEYATEVPNVGGNRWMSNKVRIEDSGLKSNILSPYRRQEYSSYDYAPLDSPKLGIYFSPSDPVNEDIIETFGAQAFDDFVGDPSDKYRDYYTGLKNVSFAYWQKYDHSNNIWDYLRVVELYDYGIFRIIKEMLPARAKSVVGLLIEPNILERPKHRGIKEPSVTREDHSDTIVVKDLFTTTGDFPVFETEIFELISGIITSDTLCIGSEIDTAVDIETTGEISNIISELQYIYDVGGDIPFTVSSSNVDMKTDEPTQYVYYNVYFSASAEHQCINPYWQREVLQPVIYPKVNWEYSQSYQVGSASISGTIANPPNPYGYYSPNHYIYKWIENVTSWKNLLYLGCKQTIDTTPDRGLPVEVTLTNPNTLIISDNKDIRIDVE